MSSTTYKTVEAESAFNEARSRYLEQQAFGFMQTVRALKVNLFMADQANELAPELRQALYEELAGCAAIVEVRK